jgi:hypothetical protein
MLLHRLLCVLDVVSVEATLICKNVSVGVLFSSKHNDTHMHACKIYTTSISKRLKSINLGIDEVTIDTLLSTSTSLELKE